MDDTLTITLRKPVEFASITYDKLDLREPTAAEFVIMNNKEGAEGDIAAVSLIAGVPVQAVEKIGVRDLLKGARFLAGFLAVDPPTGDSA